VLESSATRGRVSEKMREGSLTLGSAPPSGLFGSLQEISFQILELSFVSFDDLWRDLIEITMTLSIYLLQGGGGTRREVQRFRGDRSERDAEERESHLADAIIPNVFLGDPHRITI
jgi:hypothetical protein